MLLQFSIAPSTGSTCSSDFEHCPHWNELKFEGDLYQMSQLEPHKNMLLDGRRKMLCSKNIIHKINKMVFHNKNKILNTLSRQKNIFDPST